MSTLDKIHEAIPEDSIKQNYMCREDIKVLSPREREESWKQHIVRVNEFLKRIAEINPIFLR